MTEEDQLKRLVIFAILMENDGGILDKSSNYILEKYSSALRVKYPGELLDVSNKNKFYEWCRRWLD